MKKMTAAFLAALMFCMAALGCGSLPADTPDAAGKLSIVATGFAPYDFARQIAGDHANVKMLLPPGSESHTFEPTAQDILAIAACDVFVCVGGESETWIENILDSIDTSKIRIVSLMELVETIEEETADGMTVHGHSHEEEEETESETEAKKAEAVRTGDSTPVLPFLILLVVSAGLLLFLGERRFHRTRR